MAQNDELRAVISDVQGVAFSETEFLQLMESLAPGNLRADLARLVDPVLEIDGSVSFNDLWAPLMTHRMPSRAVEDLSFVLGEILGGSNQHPGVEPMSVLYFSVLYLHCQANEEFATDDPSLGNVVLRLLDSMTNVDRRLLRPTADYLLAVAAKIPAASRRTRDPVPLLALTAVILCGAAAASIFDSLRRRLESFDAVPDYGFSTGRLRYFALWGDVDERLDAHWERVFGPRGTFGLRLANPFQGGTER